MPPRAPVSVGINPTMAVYTLVLGGACAVAAYTEKYRRDQDEIDDRLKEQYFSNMREQQAKVPQITQAIRGQDVRLDSKMNKWVWGGKASLPTQESPAGSSGGGGGGGNSNTAAVAEAAISSSPKHSSLSVADEDEWGSEADLEEEKKLSKKERRRRRKERKMKREERKKKQQEAERKKLVMQSVAAGAAVGAVAVATSLFLGSGRK